MLSQTPAENLSERSILHDSQTLYQNDSKTFGKPEPNLTPNAKLEKGQSGFGIVLDGPNTKVKLAEALALKEEGPVQATRESVGSFGQLV